MLKGKALKIKNADFKEFFTTMHTDIFLMQVMIIFNESDSLGLLLSNYYT